MEWRHGFRYLVKVCRSVYFNHAGQPRRNLRKSVTVHRSELTSGGRRGLFPIPIRASCRRHESCRNSRARLPPSASGATVAIPKPLHQSCWPCAISLRSASAHRLRKLRTSSHAPLREMTHSQLEISCSASIASPLAPPLRQYHTTPPTPAGTCPAVRSTSQLTNPCPSAPVVVISLSCTI